MKTSIIFFATLLITSSGFGQESKYQAAMLGNLAKLERASTPSDYLQCASQFERIAIAEKKLWLPYYYASYTLIILSYNESELSEIDALLDQAQGMLDSAFSLAPDESELHALQAFLYPSRILVDPMGRGMLYFEKMHQSIARSKELNPENPRPWFLEGVSKLNMPPSMGGGAEGARPLLLEAQRRFSAFNHEDILWPSWGEESNQAELAKL